MQVIHTSVDGVPQAELDATESGFAYEFYYDDEWFWNLKHFQIKMAYYLNIQLQHSGDDDDDDNKLR